ncbi:Maf family protein [Eubacteriales bacterium KG127]
MEKSMIEKKKIILASGSPRRKEILMNHGISPIIIPSNVEEILPPHLSQTGLPEEIQEEIDRNAVEYLALLKAKDIARRICDHSFDEKLRGAGILLSQKQRIIVIGADTMVFKGEKLGKPKDRGDAYRMIKLLQGGAHKVITGVAIIEISSENCDVQGAAREKLWEIKQFSDATSVMCKPMTKEEIEEYINLDEPYDKAGGYAIQGAFAKHIKSYEGDYENVIGLPYKKIKELLQSE